MVALTSMVDYNVEEGVAVLTLNNPPVNALSQGVRQGLKEGVEKVYYSNGQLQYELLYKDDKLEGMISQYFEDGKGSRSKK